MMKEYDVTITEISQRTVFVVAESPEAAEQAARKRWTDGEFMLDSDDFESVKFEAEETTVGMDYTDLSELLTRANTGGMEITGYIVFKQENFNKLYSEKSRSYSVSSNNKAFNTSEPGTSVYGSCLDGTDQNIRLDEYLTGPNAWKIERCFFTNSDYNKVISLPDQEEKK